MKTIQLSIIATLALPGILACNPTPDAPALAHGGHTVTMPSPDGGSPAAASDAASDSAGACSIPCLAGVGLDCIPSGRCTTEVSLGGTRMCISNGVKVAQKTPILPLFPTVTTYYKPDGNTCYVVEGSVNAGTGAIMLTWKDPAGAVLATATSPRGFSELAVSCQGQTYGLFTSGCLARDGHLGGESGEPALDEGVCTAGRCP